MISNNRLSLLLIFFISVMTLGCSGSGSDPQQLSTPNANQPANTNSIVGLWNTTDARIDDVSYLEISQEGQVRLIDYLGDGYDAGGNCHLIFRGTIRLIENNFYEIAYTDLPDFDPVEARLIYVTLYNDNGNLYWQEEGNNTGVLYPPVAGVDPNFNICQ